MLRTGQDKRRIMTAMSDVDTIERSVTIDAPADRVAAHLIDFRRWVDWSPWEGLDPGLTRTYTGAEAGIGATYEWSGNRKAGAGHMQITDVTRETVDVDLRFTRPFKSTSAVRFALQPHGSATTVVWTMSSPRTLMTRIVGLFMNMDKTIGTDLAKGLANLKARVEED